MLAVNLHSGAYPQGECGKAQGFLSLLRLVVCANKNDSKNESCHLAECCNLGGDAYIKQASCDHFTECQK